MDAPHEIAISFAGEDREFARSIANGLRDSGVHVFFDEFEPASLWGEHLDDFFHKTFSKARYCLMIVSKHYARKAWPSHERHSAFAGGIARAKNTVLPVRLDDTEVAGLVQTIGYIDGRRHSPDEIVAMALTKLSRDSVESPSHATTKTVEIEHDAGSLDLDEPQATEMLAAKLSSAFGVRLEVDWDQRATDERRQRLNSILTFILAMKPTSVQGSDYADAYGNTVRVYSFKRQLFRETTKEFNCNLPLAKLMVRGRPFFLYMNPLLHTNTRRSDALLALWPDKESEGGRELDWEDPRCLMLVEVVGGGFNSREKESVKGFKSISGPDKVLLAGELDARGCKLAENNGFTVFNHITTVARAVRVWDEALLKLWGNAHRGS